MLCFNGFNFELTDLCVTSPIFLIFSYSFLSIIPKKRERKKHNKNSLIIHTKLSLIRHTSRTIEYLLLSCYYGAINHFIIFSIHIDF